MISTVRGTVLDIELDHAVIEVGGVGGVGLAVRTARNTNQSFRSCAYTLMVFGDRSMPLRYLRYRSIGATGPSLPSTVHDSRCVAGGSTR